MRWGLACLVGLWVIGAAMPAAAGEREEADDGSRAAVAGPGGATDSGGPEDRVAVNRANAEQLMRLPGIGPKKAQAIIEARERRPFRRPSDLRRVKGFGPKTILRLAPCLSFE